MKLSLFFLLLFYIATVNIAYSQFDFDDDRPAHAYKMNSFAISSDQDFFSFFNEDRNYTMGFEFSLLASESLERGFSILPKIRQGVDYLFGLQKLYDQGKEFKVYISSINLLGSAFTPKDLKLKDPDLMDRPYGSILVYGSSRTTAFNENSSEPNTTKYALSTSFYIGYLGLNISKNLQTFIHEEIVPSPKPMGWHNQVSNGGEPTLLYNVSVLTRLLELKNKQKVPVFQSTAETGVQLGYYTNIYAGTQFRAGHVAIPYWLGNNHLQNVSQFGGATLGDEQKCIKTFGFMSLRGRYVIYNALLQGQFLNNPYELKASEISRFILEAELGISIIFCNKYNIIFSPIIFRTPEFSSSNRSHVWGNISLIISWKRDNEE